MPHPIGLLVICLAAFSFYRKPAFALGLLIISTLFGTASAINLGNSSLMISNLLALVVILRIALWAGFMELVRPLLISAAGVWLLLLYVYAVLSGYFAPRFFAGATNTVAITEATSGIRVIQFIPLVPKGTNVTQSIYFTLGVGAFCGIAAYLRRTQDYATIITLFVAMGAIQVAAAVLDLFTYYTGSAFLLSPVRTANYAYLCAVEKGGLKRMCGFMSEASSFASYTLVVFAIFLNLWIDRIRPVVTGSLAAALFFFLAISTSGSGYVGLALLSMLMLVGRGLHIVDGHPFSRPAELVIGAFLGICLTIFLFLLVPSLVDTLNSFLEETVFGKLESDSGRERTLWNMTAYQNFLDTQLLGAGLGSTRASSIVMVLLSQVGIPGTLFFAMFIYTLIMSRTTTGLSHEGVAVVTAVRWAIIAHLIVAILAKGDFVFPMLFYVLCGVAASATVAFGALNRERALGAQRRRLAEQSNL